MNADLRPRAADPSQQMRNAPEPRDRDAHPPAHGLKRDGDIPATAVFVINRFHTAWGHKIIYDRETLSSMVQDAGFVELQWCEVGKSEHAALCGVEGHWRTMPAEFNLLETMVLEARKQ